MRSMIKYLSNGPEVRVIQTLNDGRVLVEPIFENPNDGDEYSGNPFIVNEKEIFDKPPTHKKSEEVIKLNQQIEELNTKLRGLRKEVKDFETTHTERIKCLQQFKGLELLEKFVKGEITHYVEIRSYSNPKIIPFDKTEADYTDGQGVRSLKLLSLFGKATGDLEWRLSHYSDGSGSYSTVIPCVSLEEAEQIIRNWIKDTVADNLDTNTNSSPSRKIIELAKEYKYELPTEYIELVVKREKENYNKKVQKLEKELADVKAQKDSLEDVDSLEDAFGDAF